MNDTALILSPDELSRTPVESDPLMELFLIRHAQSANNALPETERVEDPGLTDLGVEQARCLAEWLPTLGLTQLITSPFRRTLLTAKAISKSTGLTPSVRVDLHEVGGCYRGYSPGCWQGRPGMNRREIEAAFSGFEFDDVIRDDGWWASKPYESWDDARQRAVRLLERTTREFAQTHGRVAYVMHADFKNLFIEQFHNKSVLAIPRNASVSRVILADQTMQLADYNMSGHLRPEMVTV
ncbi:MAG: histidine phosphatase family protein [Pirellulaceae bacterium]